MKITLETIENFTNQEVFDFVCKHLLEQGRQCSDGRNPLYKRYNEQGKLLLSAIGCMMADSYRDRMEGTTIGFLIPIFYAQEIVSEEKITLLKRLALLHNHAIYWDRIPESLKFFAERYGLEYNL